MIKNVNIGGIFKSCAQMLSTLRYIDPEDFFFFFFLNSWYLGYFRCIKGNYSQYFGFEW